MTKSITDLLDLHKRSMEFVMKFPKRRDLFRVISSEQGRHLVGIVGPKGVGKSVLLMQLAEGTPKSFYISADAVPQGEFFDTVKSIKDKLDVQALFIDEIHYQKGYQEDLKKIYDFLQIKVVFTSSVSLSLFDAQADLSRRVRLYHLDVFSLREYLGFRKGIIRARLSLNDIIEGKWSHEHLADVSYFGEYLKGGLLPFAMEEPAPLPLLENVLKKIIENDIPSFARIRVDEIDFIKKVMTFIGRSPVDGINYSSIARNIGITKYKSQEYVNMLEKSFLVTQVFPKGTNVLKEPKILVHLPYRLLYAGYEEAIGQLREDFFVHAMTIAGIKCHYLKTNRGQKTPDYMIETGALEIVVEVGGRGKGREQFKGVDAKKEIIFTHSLDTDARRRPLHMLGYLN